MKSRIMKRLLVLFLLIFCNQIYGLGWALTPSSMKNSVVFVSSTSLQPDDVMHPVVHKGLGPGFVFDKAGHVLVLMSSISDKHSIECSIQSKGYWPAVLIGSDYVTGIGVLQIKAPEKVLASLQPVTMTRKRPGLGESIYVIGVNPDGSQTAVKGFVSTTSVPIGLKNRSIEKLIQTTVFVHRGVDGAPAFNSKGQCIGMAVSVAEEPPPNVGYIMPVSLVKWIAQSIIETGSVTRAYLGAEVVTIDKVLSRLLNLPAEKGALVVKVAEGSPAHRAGLRGCSKKLRLGNRLYPMGGDLIVAIDRIPIDSDQKLFEVLNEKGPGTQVLISFYRDGRLKRQNVVLGRR